MKLALIGTGLMGKPMAERLLRTNYDLTVYNRTIEKALPLQEAGATIVDTPNEAIESTDCTILTLTDINAIKAVLFPADQPKPRISRRTIINMSTILPDESITLKKDIEKEEGTYFEAPVLGSIPQVEQGTLLVMVGASPPQFQEWKSVLKSFTAEPYHIGEVGKATALKLAFNQLIASLAAAFSFSYGLVRRRGIDEELFMKLLRNSSLYAEQFDKKLERIKKRDFSNPHFPTVHLLKDLKLVEQEGKSIGLATGSIEGLIQIVQKAMESGWDRTDYSSFYNAIDPEE